MWMIFATEAEAQSYCDAASASLPRRPGDVTLEWDVPHPLANGQWAVTPAAPDIGQELPAEMLMDDS